MVQQDYYVKKVYYADYVKNIIMPLNSIENNNRNDKGVKNIGENEVKLKNSLIRSKGNAIRKAYHNFSGLKKISFLTLTYAKNITDIKKCKKDLNNFFKKINYWLKDKKINFKYFYTYEYQERGSIHFHILLNYQLPNKIVLQNWPYGLNKNLKVKQNTNEFVVGYLSKYITKNLLDTQKSKNNYDLNIKAYQFSKSCENPKIEKGVIKRLKITSLIELSKNALNMKFIGRKLKNGVSRLMGAIYDFKTKISPIVTEKYVPFDIQKMKHVLKN